MQTQDSNYKSALTFRSTPLSSLSETYCSPEDGVVKWNPSAIQDMINTCIDTRLAADKQAREHAEFVAKQEREKSDMERDKRINDIIQEQKRTSALSKGLQEDMHKMLLESQRKQDMANEVSQLKQDKANKHNTYMFTQMQAMFMQSFANKESDRIMGKKGKRDDTGIEGSTTEMELHENESNVGIHDKGSVMSEEQWVCDGSEKSAPLNSIVRGSETFSSNDMSISSDIIRDTGQNKNVA